MTRMSVRPRSAEQETAEVRSRNQRRLLQDEGAVWWPVKYGRRISSAGERCRHTLLGSTVPGMPISPSIGFTISGYRTKESDDGEDEDQTVQKPYTA